MKYLSVEEARDTTGVRLVLSAGVPGPFGEAVKTMFALKGLSYVPVAQYMGEPNDDLFAWTGMRNAPILVAENSKPIDRWLDIINYVERVQPEPSLLPRHSVQRALTIGICNEICGEWGLGWARRVIFLAAATDDSAQTARLQTTYYASTEAANHAPGRIADILAMLKAQVAAQRAAGSPYLVGDQLSAADIYWAFFSMSLRPPEDVFCPMPEMLRTLYTVTDPQILAAMDQSVFEQRDFIFANHIETPISY